jgi:urease accessory protein
MPTADMTVMPALSPPDTRPQRSRGAVAASFVAGRLHRLRQEGSAKGIALPGPELVVLNTSGGLTGGDRYALDLDTGDGAHVTATTQTAERVYRAAEGRATIRITARVGQAARLDWLPQETILFDGCAADRVTTIDLAADATCLTCETLVLGRAAMGETVSRLALRDTRLIRRAGRPVHFDPFVLDPARLNAAAGLADARALSTIVLVSRGAEDALGPARAALADPSVTAAASAWDGRLVVRMMAADAFPLRRQVVRLLATLRGAPLPRVWQS